MSLHKNQELLCFDEAVARSHHFMLMLQYAFNVHKAIYITPDNLWLLICQGVAEHLRLNNEKYRALFTDVEQKEVITIRRDDFVQGGENPWPEIFHAFSGEVHKKIKTDLAGHLLLSFTTTTAVERAAYEICFLDTMSSYFEYEFISLCGIPEIKIKGVEADYLKIKEGLIYFEQFELGWWTEKLSAIIDKFIGAFRGEEDTLFWKSIYKENNRSGGPFISGWIAEFFPYLRKTMYREGLSADLEGGGIKMHKVLKVLSEKEVNEDLKTVDVLIRNPHLSGDKAFDIKPDDFLCGLSKVPFNWLYLGKKTNMYFVSGFMGVSEDETNTLETHINWAVIHANQ